MILRALFALCFLYTAPIASAEPLTLSGAEIVALLSGTTLEGIHVGAEWRQEFGVAGTTVYSTRGRTDHGKWQVRDDQYCSQWPPSETWDCYAITRDGDLISFVPVAGGEAWPARLAE